MNTKSKTIGILGGMGPQASVYLYKLLIDISVSDFGARRNDEYPEILLYSVPVPDFISDSGNKSAVLEMLKDRTDKLKLAGVGFGGIACNTAHVLLPDLEKHSGLRFVSVVNEVAREVKEERVGLLGTPSTINSMIYEVALNKHKIEAILPSAKQITLLECVIRRILGGELTEGDRKTLSTITDDLVRRGAEAIIVGCTELPLVFPRSCKVPVYNSSEILARALLRNYYD